jgi:hypothetical protein
MQSKTEFSEDVMPPAVTYAFVTASMYPSYKEIQRRRGSVFGTTAYGLDDRGVGVLVPVGSRNFTTPYSPDRNWGPPNLLSNGYQVPFSSGEKRKKREADHSAPTSAEVKNTWVYTSTSPYVSVE